jgi:hypothetical protein
MRVRTLVLAGLLVALTSLACGTAAAAGRDENPDGFGIYSPLDRKARVYRYDARSWYYRQPRYYPYYASNYWVPRSYMRYRYRYLPYGPRYRYHPGWGYPLWGPRDDSCCRPWRW